MDEAPSPSKKRSPSIKILESRYALVLASASMVLKKLLVFKTELFSPVLILLKF